MLEPITLKELREIRDALRREIGTPCDLPDCPHCPRYREILGEIARLEQAQSGVSDG